MSVRRQRPQWVAPHARLIQSLGIRDLWVPQGTTLRNLAGDQGDLIADTTASKWSTGPGGYGLDTQNVSGNGYSSNAQLIRGLPRTQATIFGVVSVRSATTGQIYRFGFSGDTRYMIRVMFDATNGLKTTNVNGAYTSTDEQSMSVLPPLGHPFAFVALYSYPYQGVEDVREIYDSFGNRAPAAASNASWDGIDTGFVRIGTDFTNSIDGHVYMVGSSERLWKQSEIQDFLSDPYRLIDGSRQQSRRFTYLAAGGTGEGSTAQTLSALTSAATGTLAIVGSTAQTLSALTSAATGTLAIVGSTAQTLSALTSATTGALAIVGSTAQTLGSLVCSGAGISGSGGTTAQTLAALASTATGTLAIVGSTAQTLSALTSAATGTLAIAGSTAQTLGALVCSATNSAGSAATLAATLGGLSLVSAGTGPWQIQASSPGAWVVQV